MVHNQSARCEAQEVGTEFIDPNTNGTKYLRTYRFHKIYRTPVNKHDCSIENE